MQRLDREVQRVVLRLAVPLAEEALITTVCASEGLR